MMRKILLAMVGIAMLAACTSKGEEPKSRDEQIADIETMEKALSSVDIARNDSNAMKMVALYRQFANDFADDSLAPVYMMRAADLDINLGETDTAIALLDSIIAVYPGFEDMGGCYFLKGYAYERAEQYDKARVAYGEFIDNYPDHDLAADTRKSMQYLGMTPEEMLKAVLAAKK